MNKVFVSEFRNPNTGEKYILHSDEEFNGYVKHGKLVGMKANEYINIRDFIPRFVDDSNYADNFGRQWNFFRRTQFDSFNGTSLTRQRFLSGTKWNSDEIKGQKILEAGCGAGRFTEILLDLGARVYSFDYSTAVEACYQNNNKDELLLFQGDIYSIPFEYKFFDKVFCYGVLQHTPDPKSAFMNLVKYVRSGGKIAVDIYMKDGRIRPWKSKYIWRPLTVRMDSDLLFRLVKWYIPKWLPIDTFLRKIPLLKAAAAVIPCWNYTGLPLTNEQRIEWAVLDTFDALSPKFDKPETVEEFRSWFEEAPLEDIDIRIGGNGIIGNARKI